MGKEVRATPRSRKEVDLDLLAFALLELLKATDALTRQETKKGGDAPKTKESAA